MNVDIIKKNYSEFSNDKIETIAKTKGTTLPKEVVSVLNEEIRKRGLSPNLEIDFDSIDTERKERIQRAHNQLMHGNNKFYQSSSGSTWMLVSIGILMYIFSIVLAGAIGQYLNHTVGFIAKWIAVGFVGKLIYDYSKNKPIMVETFDDYMIVAQNPYLSMGKISRFIAMIKVFRNKLTRIKIPYQNIDRLYQNTGFFDDANMMIVGRDEKGNLFEFPSALILLDSKRDLPKVFKILRAKGITKIDIEI